MRLTARPAAGCRWDLPRLRLGQQLPGFLRRLTASEKRAWKRASKEYAAGGRLEGYAQQGLQEERFNPNHAGLRPEEAAFWRGVQALWEARRAKQEAWRALGAARAAEAVKERQRRAKTRRTRAARARRAARVCEQEADADAVVEAALCARQVPARPRALGGLEPVVGVAQEVPQGRAVDRFKDGLLTECCW